MTGNKNLLDTNIIVDFLRGRSYEKQFLEQSNIFFVPAIVIGELVFGAEYSSQPEKHYKQFNDFIKGKKIINVDQDTAIVYGKIKADLKKRGKLIPENDIWIAAIAIQHNFTLITNDKHFANISLLKYKELQ
jgi:tRNA(fMet)-specific endonuclease VapC